MEVRRHPFSDLSWKVTEPEYRADPALSFSTLQRYEREGKFRAMATLNDQISSPALSFGTLVDALVTGGYGEFDSLFCVAELPEISENLQHIAKVLFETYGAERTFDELLDDELAAVGESCDYYAGDKYIARRSRLIREGCREYYNVLSSATGKTLVSQKDYEDALACKEAFLTSPYTMQYFESDDENVEIYYQLKFKNADPETGIMYRCMVDMLRIVHSEKTVYPFDIKTTSKPEEEFPKSFLQYLYNLQSRNYWRRIKQAMKEDPFYKDYKLANYTFLVVNRSTLTPLAWVDSKTQTTGNVVYKTNSGKKITTRDPYVIGQEIMSYKHENPRYPKGCWYFNDITNYIEEDM